MIFGTTLVYKMASADDDLNFMELNLESCMRSI